MNRSCSRLSLLLVASALAVPAAAGPPIFCHPLDTGGAASLPMGDGPFEPAELSAADAASHALRLLSESDDATAHQETIRRFVVYLERDEKADAKALAAGFVRSLKDRVLRLEAADAEAPKRALAWFDVGMAMKALDEMRHRPAEPPNTYLLKAAQLAPRDHAMHLGIAVANLMRGDAAVRYKYLESALVGAGDDPRLARNLRTTLRRFAPDLLGENDDETLAAITAARRAIEEAE